MDAELEAGQTMVFEATEHTTENIGDTESVAILIELK